MTVPQPWGGPGPVASPVAGAAEPARYYGVYPATVSDNQDKDAQGRVCVLLPWSPDGDGGSYEVWARLATTLAGADRGTWFVPDSGDEVLVSFGGGDPRYAYVVGTLWNGADAPPVAMDADNTVKAIVSRRGVRVTLDDSAGAEVLRLETPGRQRVTLDDGARSLRLEDSNGNSVELASGNLTITAAAALTLRAATVSISAGSAKVDSAMWSYTGVVKCDSAIATTVIGTTYLPGVGNML